jgi:RimJ/RimL family protein N-acetyltransferase
VLSHREVCPEDVARICSFPQTAEELYFLYPKATHPLTPDQLRRAIEQRFDSTVVLRDHQLCGFANFHVRTVSGPCAIGNVVVAPDARAKGVGRYLIEVMIRKALLGCRAKEVRISCFNGNVAGLLLYAKLGFAPFAVEPRLDHQGTRVALIHMRLAEDAVDRYRQS